MGKLIEIQTKHNRDNKKIHTANAILYALHIFDSGEATRREHNTWLHTIHLCGSNGPA